MVYRSLGKAVAQTELWPAVAKENRLGSLSSTTHLMTKDALERGFAAVAFQARHPLLTLLQCRNHGIRAVLNHRLHAETGTGHYTVLVDIDDQHVTLHDPYYGPSQRLTHTELMDLWQPGFPGSEVVGFMLIAIAPPPPALSVCELCQTPIPARVECPHCQEPVELQPDMVLRCMTRSCIARAWNYICCPTCDYTWTFDLPSSNGEEEAVDLPAPAPENPPPPPAAADDPWKLGPMFAKLDEFVSHVLSLPVAASHPDIRKQLDFIIAGKDKLRLAQAQELVNQKLHQEKFGTLVEAARQKAVEHEKRMEELNRPAAPLDPHELGRALLKNLGWDS